MNAKFKRALTAVAWIVVGAAFAAMIWYFAIIGIPYLISDGFHGANATLLAEGPWNKEQAVWVSEDESFRLTVFENGAAVGFLKDAAGKWHPCQLNKMNHPAVELTTDKGLLLHADAEIADGRLVLTDLKYETQSFFPEWEEGVTIAPRDFSADLQEIFPSTPPAENNAEANRDYNKILDHIKNNDDALRAGYAGAYLENGRLTVLLCKDEEACKAIITDTVGITGVDFKSATHSYADLQAKMDAVTPLFNSPDLPVIFAAVDEKNNAVSVAFRVSEEDAYQLRFYETYADQFEQSPIACARIRDEIDGYAEAFRNLLGNADGYTFTYGEDMDLYRG